MDQGLTGQGLLRRFRRQGTSSQVAPSVIRREANKVAHELAQRAMKKQEYVVTRLNAPECIQRQIVIEAAEGVGDPQTCNSLICD
jgi:hypothetical protein